MFATDRAITGQDGVAYSDPAAAAGAHTFPASLAARLLDGDESIEHVYVASNQVVALRRNGWDEESLGGTADRITRFFVYYAGEL
jgi:hypothetical protein